MCGIIASIGTPKKPELAHRLMTELLVQTETRGDNATGFWCSEYIDGEDVIYYSKEPVKSSDFVKTDMWEQLTQVNADVLVSHCRKSSEKGSENININNHPFVTSDYRTALVHNGNVPEFDALKSDYALKSNCDSEILLRMLEHGESYDSKYSRQELAKLRIDSKRFVSDLKEKEEVPTWVHRLMGIRDIYARINWGAMAVAVGEKWPDGTSALWLFRDKERPLHVIDIQQKFGQIYVVSTIDIWRDAIEALPEMKPYLDPTDSIIQFPAMYVWLITFSREGKFEFRKWKINKERRHDTTWDKERPKTTTLAEKTPDATVVTNLHYENHEVLPPESKGKGEDGDDGNDDGGGDDTGDDDNSSSPEKLVEKEPLRCPSPSSNGASIQFPIEPQGLIQVKQQLPQSEVIDNSQVIDVAEMDRFEDALAAIKNSTSDIGIMIHNLVLEGTLTRDEFEEIISALESTAQDMRGEKYRVEVLKTNAA